MAKVLVLTADDCHDFSWHAAATYVGQVLLRDQGKGGYSLTWILPMYLSIRRRYPQKGIKSELAMSAARAILIGLMAAAMVSYICTSVN